MPKIFLLLLFVCSIAHAQNIYTSGDQQSTILKEIFFPEFTLQAVPGAEGTFVWKNLLKDKKSIAITIPTSTHLLPLFTNHLPNDPTQEAELLAVLTTTKMGIYVNNKSTINSIKDFQEKTYTIGSVGEKGICGLLLNKIAKDYKFEFVHVPYKTPQQARVDLLGGHIDAHCTAASIGSEYIKNNDGRLIYTMDKDYGVVVRTYIYANKNLSKEIKNKIIKSITRKLSDEEIKMIMDINLTIDIHTGSKAAKIFNDERTFWQLTKDVK
jgi:tripartite-type tricarboxylate transporter receptor subunit TctC